MLSRVSEDQILSPVDIILAQMWRAGGGGAAPPRTPLLSRGLRPPDPPKRRCAPLAAAVVGNAWVNLNTTYTLCNICVGPSVLSALAIVIGAASPPLGCAGGTPVHHACLRCWGGWPWEEPLHVLWHSEVAQHSGSFERFGSCNRRKV